MQEYIVSFLTLFRYPADNPGLFHQIDRLVDGTAGYIVSVRAALLKYIFSTELGGKFAYLLEENLPLISKVGLLLTQKIPEKE